MAKKPTLPQAWARKRAAKQLMRGRGILPRARTTHAGSRLACVGSGKKKKRAPATYPQKSRPPPSCEFALFVVSESFRNQGSHTPSFAYACSRPFSLSLCPSFLISRFLLVPRLVSMQLNNPRENCRITILWLKGSRVNF